VTIDFVVHDGQLFVTGAKMGRDWMKNTLKNPAVEVTIEGVTRRMRARVVQSGETQKLVERLYRKKYPFAARFLRLARPGSTIFELKGED
jgi:deazaflavin-dependent oxidoreductase (nitroreductase family)